MKIAVIGDDAYLAQGLAQVFNDDQITNFPRIDLMENVNELKDFDVVINFTLQPVFSKQILPNDQLIDGQIASVLAGSNTKLVMLSSRKVYGSYPDSVLLSERDQLNPVDFYAKNKATAEKIVSEKLPDQHLIVRIANILDVPTERKSYKTFIGWISEQIFSSGFLSVTENRQVKKDFISRDYFHQALHDLIKKDAKGIINIGSGFALPIELILTKIVGKSNIRFTENEPPARDQFILNVEKLHQYTKPFSKKDLDTVCSKANLFLSKHKKGFQNVKD